MSGYKVFKRCLWWCSRDRRDLLLKASWSRVRFPVSWMSWPLSRKRWGKVTQKKGNRVFCHGPQKWGSTVSENRRFMIFIKEEPVGFLSAIQKGFVLCGEERKLHNHQKYVPKDTNVNFLHLPWSWSSSWSNCDVWIYFCVCVWWIGMFFFLMVFSCLVF